MVTCFSKILAIRSRHFQAHMLWNFSVPHILQTEIKTWSSLITYHFLYSRCSSWLENHWQISKGPPTNHTTEDLRWITNHLSEDLQRITINSSEVIRRITNNSSEVIRPITNNSAEVIPRITNNSSEDLRRITNNSSEVIQRITINSSEDLRRITTSFLKSRDSL